MADDQCAIARLGTWPKRTIACVIWVFALADDERRVKAVRGKVHPPEWRVPLHAAPQVITEKHRHG